MKSIRWGATFLVMAAIAMTAPGLAAKTLVYCSEANPESFNPQLNITNTGLDATSPIFDTLVAFESGGTRIIPALAESWAISPDGLAYTFNLRRGVKFHSRPDYAPTREFNADDVIFSFERQWRADHPFHKISGTSYNYFNDMSMPSLLKAVSKLDDHTVRLELTRPEAPLLANLAMGFTAILSAEYADALLTRGTPEKLDQSPLGTGPFQFVTYQRDVAIRYKAFADHWAGRPPIDNLVFSITLNAAVRLNKLKAGECHVMAFPAPADLPKMRHDPDLTILEQEGLNIGYLAFNTNRKPFDDVRVRRAINLAVDKKTLVEAVYQDAGQPAKNPIPPAMWSYNDTIEDYAYDPEQARRLLAEAGYPDGFDTDLWYMPVARPYMPNAKRAAEMILADLEKVGVRVSMVTDEWTVYRKRVHSGDEHQAALFGWIGDNGDPDNFLYVLLGCEAARPSGANIAKWCDKDFNDRLVRAKQSADVAERTALYREAQTIFKREAPWLPIAHSKEFLGLRKEVEGFRADPFGRHLFTGVDLR